MNNHKEAEREHKWMEVNYNYNWQSRDKSLGYRQEQTQET